MHKKTVGFTIVELLVVIVVIAILASISIVSYNGITNRAKETALKSDLQNGATQLQVEQIETGVYPADADDLKRSEGTEFTYSSTNTTFCLAATNDSLPGKSFYITQDGAIVEGECPEAVITDGSFIQTITDANCPTTRTRAVDARDNHTYWVKKLDDGKCWMLTNLAYAGGGTNTYADTKVLSNGTGENTLTYTEAKYYIPSSTTNYTLEPNSPGVATDGTGQYGYFYNWCAAMGAQNGTNGQPNTAACANATTPAPDVAITVCPAGWRLPTGQATTGELTLLNNAVNSGSTTSSAALRSEWQAQLGGLWNINFYYPGSNGYYWSSTLSSTIYARVLYFGASSVTASTNGTKTYGLAVRCVAV